MVKLKGKEKREIALNLKDNVLAFFLRGCNHFQIIPLMWHKGITFFIFQKN